MDSPDIPPSLASGTNWPLTNAINGVARHMEKFSVEPPVVAAACLFGSDTPLSDLSVLVQIPAVRELAETAVSGVRRQVFLILQDKEPPTQAEDVWRESFPMEGRWRAALEATEREETD